MATESCRLSFKAAAVIAAAVFLPINPAAAAEPQKKPVPVVEGASGSSSPQQQAVNKDLQDRIQRLEQTLKGQALIDIISRLDALQQEVQTMSGQLEVLNHEIEQIKKTQRDQYVDIDNRLRRNDQGGAAGGGASAPAAGEIEELRKRQRDLYLDIDNRLRRLEQRNGVSPQSSAPSFSEPSAGSNSLSGTGAASTGAAGPAVAPAAVAASAAASPGAPPTAQEKEFYERAFTQLKEGHYGQAIGSLSAFVQTYPNSELAANAQYWLGEANYVQRQFSDAAREFSKVLNDYPESSKRPDAMLKLGFTYKELGDQQQAMAILNDLVAKYPNTSAARLASKRVQDMQSP